MYKLNKTKKLITKKKEKKKKTENPLHYTKITRQRSLKKTQTQKWTIMQEASGLSTAPNATRRTSCKAWNSPADYPKFSM